MKGRATMANDDNENAQEASLALHGDVADLKQFAAQPYRYSRKSYVAWSVLCAVLFSILPVSLLINKSQEHSVLVIYVASMVLLWIIIFLPQFIRQIRERKRLGQPFSRFSTRSHIEVYGFDALYLILYYSFNGPMRIQHLLNNVYGASVVDTSIVISIAIPLVTVVAPMAIVYYIFLGPQLYKQKKERREMRRREAHQERSA